MKKLILLLICLSCWLAIQAQSSGFGSCGTTIDPSEIPFLQSVNTTWHHHLTYPTAYKNAYTGATIFVPIQVHIIRESSGNGGYPEADLSTALDRLNEIYINASLQFYQCAAVNYIDDDVYYNFDTSEEGAIDTAHSVANVINLYIAGTVSSGANNLCGFANFPGPTQPDLIMMAAGCMNNGSTLAHEFGHYFLLFHTHETAFGAEAVDGSDCASEGDLLCDTPADPNLSGNVDPAGCAYIGTDLDEHGQVYQPEITNAMSYVTRACRFNFTPDQYDRILWAYQTYRTYLNCGPAPLSAAFYQEAEENCGDTREVHFFNASTGNPTTYRWDFGDGTTSSQESPSHMYRNKGVYAVRLIVEDGGNADTITQRIPVGAVTLPYVNNFEAGDSALKQFHIESSMKNNLEVNEVAAHAGTYGLTFTGIEQTSANFSSPFFETPTTSTAFEDLWNPYYKTKMTLCVDATGESGVQLAFDKRQLYVYNDNYTNFRITVDGVQIGDVYQVEKQKTDDTAFTQVWVDLSAYDGQVFTLGLEGTHKYALDVNGNTNGGSATFIDNLSLSSNPLPVEWLSFAAEPQGIRTVDLHWQTASEVNNDFFTVERSRNGQDWTALAHVPAAPGQPQGPNSYESQDRQAAIGISYYRIKQTDLDGNTSYSSIQAVNLELNTTSILLYPNPTQNQLTIEGGEQALLDLQLLTLLGEELSLDTYLTSQTTTQVFLDVSSLAAGTYIIKTQTTSQTFFKQ